MTNAPLFTAFDDHISATWEVFKQCNEGKFKHELDFDQKLNKLHIQLGGKKFKELCETHKEDKQSRPQEDGFPVGYQVAMKCIKIAKCQWITEHEERWDLLPSYRWTLIAIAEMYNDEQRDQALEKGIINPDATFRKLKKKTPSESDNGSGDGDEDGNDGSEDGADDDRDNDETLSAYRVTLDILLTDTEVGAFKQQLRVLGQDLERKIEIVSFVKQDYRQSTTNHGRIDLARLDNMFKCAGVEKDTLYTALRTLGPSEIKPEFRDEWSSDNPARGFCYYIAEFVYSYFAPKDTRILHVEVPGDAREHYFLQWPNAGAMIDLAAEQFDDYSVVKHATAKRAPTFQAMPSQTCRRLAAEYFLSLVAEWDDPNPVPVLEQHEGITVVRDDVLLAGAKSRFLDVLISRNPNIEEWVYDAPRFGYGQISLAHVASKYGKKSTVFVAHSNELHPYSKRAQELGAQIISVTDGQGRMRVCQKKAREYVDLEPEMRRLVPFGFAHPTVFGSIIKVARSLPFTPDEVWTVAGSGTLNRGLQMAWPEAKFSAVSVGHELTRQERGAATIICPQHNLRFEQPCKKEERPPFPSVPEYDAKCWTPMLKKTKPYRGQKNILFWNVGS